MIGGSGDAMSLEIQPGLICMLPFFSTIFHDVMDPLVTLPLATGKFIFDAADPLEGATIHVTPFRSRQVDNAVVPLLFE